MVDILLRDHHARARRHRFAGIQIAIETREECAGNDQAQTVSFFEAVRHAPQVNLNPPQTFIHLLDHFRRHAEQAITHIVGRAVRVNIVETRRKVGV